MAAKGGHIDFMFLGLPLPRHWIHYWLEVKFFIHIYEKYLIGSVVCRSHYWLLCERSTVSRTQLVTSVADPVGGGGKGTMSPCPVKISHKKDGHRRRPHRFHVSPPPPTYPVAGSATEHIVNNTTFTLMNIFINTSL